ncbi:MAG TPA: hypothetical protein VM753_16815 [Anaeromyxobacter sp.]|jgi:hypothetical protein|nr:hypothetical protein [Anaeromyxobacter sp.]
MKPIHGMGVLAALSLAVVACTTSPGREKVNADATKATLYCSMTFTGAATGTHDCHVELSQIDGGQWELRLNAVGEGAPTFNATVRWPTAPTLYSEYSLQAPGTMTYAAATAQLSSDPTALWEAGEPITTDSLSAIITSLHADISGGPCGSFNATLVPKSGSTASGEVKVVADF